MKDDVGLIKNAAPFGGTIPQQSVLAEEKPYEASNYSWYQPEYYRYLFNLDTDEFLQRLWKSLIPWPPNFINIVRANPDLYSFPST